MRHYDLRRSDNKADIQVNLVDKKDSDFFVGRTEFDSPEVDNEVLLDANINYAAIGGFVNVKIDSAEDFDLYGHIIK